MNRSSHLKAKWENNIATDRGRSPHYTCRTFYVLISFQGEESSHLTSLKRTNPPSLSFSSSLLKRGAWNATSQKMTDCRSSGSNEYSFQPCKHNHGPLRTWRNSSISICPFLLRSTSLRISWRAFSSMCTLILYREKQRLESWFRNGEEEKWSSGKWQLTSRTCWTSTVVMKPLRSLSNLWKRFLYLSNHIKVDPITS